MTTTRTHPTLKIVGLGAALLAISIGCTSTAQAGTPPHTMRYYEQNTSFVGQPGPGNRIEFTADLHEGTSVHHSSGVSGTEHFICVFDQTGNPSCDGQEAFGGSMVLISGPGGRGDFHIPVTGGTGRYKKAKGTLDVHDIGDSLNSDIVFNLS